MICISAPKMVLFSSMNAKDKKTFFRHFVIEMDNCDSDRINSIAWLKNKTDALLIRLEIGAITSIGHQFQPQGVSLIYILSASHISIHTWPELGYFHIDLFTCKKDAKLDNLHEIVGEIFSGKSLRVTELDY